MTDSTSGDTPNGYDAKLPVPAKCVLSRRQLLAAGPTLALAPSLSSLLISGEVRAGVAPTDGRIPGYWSPTDHNRPAIDGPKGQDLWRRADKVMPSYAMFLTRSARYAGYHVLPGFITEAEGCRVKDVDGRSYIDFTLPNALRRAGHPRIMDCRRSNCQYRFTRHYRVEAAFEAADQAGPVYCSLVQR